MTKKADCQPGNLVLTLPNCVNAKVGLFAQALILINEARLAKTLEPTGLYSHSCMYAIGCFFLTVAPLKNLNASR